MSFSEDFEKSQDEKYGKISSELEKQFTSQEINDRLAKAKKEAEEASRRSYAEDLFETPLITIPEPLLLDQAAYHGLSGDLIKIIESDSETDPVAILMTFLVAIGSLVGESPHYRVESSEHHPKIFTIIEGSTSKGRKGTSVDYIRTITKDIDPAWESQITTGLSSGEGLIHAVRDEVKKDEPIDRKRPELGYHEAIIDPGVPDKRVLVIEPEFAVVLKIIAKEGNILSPILRKAWDDGRLQTLTKNNPSKASHSHISVIGHITSDELTTTLRSSEMSNGFANRFVFVHVRRNKVLPNGGASLDLPLTMFAGRLMPVIEKAKTIGRMIFDDEAQLLWNDLYTYISTMKLEGIIDKLYSRVEPYILRLSMIYALLDESPVIKKEHLLAAAAIADYWLESLYYIFGASSGDPYRDDILVYLRDEGELSKTDIYKLFNRHITASRLDALLQDMVLNCEITAKKAPTEGRPAVKFDLNSLNSLNSQKYSGEFVKFLRTKIKT